MVTFGGIGVGVGVGVGGGGVGAGVGVCVFGVCVGVGVVGAGVGDVDVGGAGAALVLLVVMLFFVVVTGLIGAIEKIGETCVVHLTEDTVHLSVQESGSEGVDVYAELQQVRQASWPDIQLWGRGGGG